jgi:hypothetical protein
MERATGIEPVLPTWESKFSSLCFQYLQNRSAKLYVHAPHTVHALPDLRIAAGRFAGRFSQYIVDKLRIVCSDRLTSYECDENLTRVNISLVLAYFYGIDLGSH